MSAIRRNGTECQRGQALVEMSFMLVVFLFLTFGITEFARALYTYATIVNYTRAAARWAVVHQYTADNVTKAQNIVLYGDPDTSSGSPMVVGLTRSMIEIPTPVTVEAEPSSGTIISQKISVIVRNYQFRFLVPIAPNITIPPFETSLITESLGSTG
jgi:Flp pilus assembly protein TadG